MSRILRDLEDTATAEGFDPGSREYELRMLELRATKCVELQGVPSCRDCPAFESCELSKSYLRALEETRSQQRKKSP